MNNGKVVKNAGSHRILYALSLGKCTSKELKVLVGAINSVSRFDGEYMKRMVDNGYVMRTDNGWCLTSKGERKSDELGPARGVRIKTDNKERMILNRPLYTGARTTPMRPGAEDFLLCPSRIGDVLIYRDGHKEKING